MIGLGWSRVRRWSKVRMGVRRKDNEFEISFFKIILLKKPFFSLLRGLFFKKSVLKNILTN